MTIHYELKGRHEVCFKAKIGLTGCQQQGQKLEFQGPDHGVLQVLDSLAKSKDLRCQ